MRNELQRQITQTSGRLIRQLKSKDSKFAKVQKHCDIITAVLQASSLKRRKFSSSASLHFISVSHTVIRRVGSSTILIFDDINISLRIVR